MLSSNFSHRTPGYRICEPLQSATPDHEIRDLFFLSSYVKTKKHHHHKHPGLGHLDPFVSRATVALSIVSSVSQLSSFLVDCSGMILKGFGIVAFSAGVKASSFCIHLSCWKKILYLNLLNILQNLFILNKTRFTLYVTFPFRRGTSPFSKIFSCVIKRRCSHWQERLRHVSVPSRHVAVQ
jgi:hypothetical protein